MDIRESVITSMQYLEQSIALLEAVQAAYQPTQTVAPDFPFSSFSRSAAEFTRNLDASLRFARKLRLEHLRKLDPLDQGFVIGEPPDPVLLGKAGLIPATTGWASYLDTGAPQIVPAGVVTPLRNLANTVIDEDKPADVDTFYDGEKIIGRLGDALIGSINATVTAMDDNASKITVWLSIGTSALLYAKTIPLTNGFNMMERFNYVFSGYMLDTFVKNGGRVMVLSDGDLSIGSVGYLFQRTHRGR